MLDMLSKKNNEGVCDKLSSQSNGIIPFSISKSDKFNQANLEEKYMLSIKLERKKKLEYKKFRLALLVSFMPMIYFIGTIFIL